MGAETRAAIQHGDNFCVGQGLADLGVREGTKAADLEEADVLADNIVVIDHGNVIAEGTAAQLKEYLVKNHAVPTAYLPDHDGKVGHLYSAKATPHLYVINKEGVLVYQGAIDSIRSAEPADIAKATNYVNAALAAVKAGKPVEKASTEPYGCSVKY